MIAQKWRKERRTCNLATKWGCNGGVITSFFSLFLHPFSNLMREETENRRIIGTVG